MLLYEASIWIVDRMDKARAGKEGPEAG
jgi:hypothetical protein